MRKLWLWGGWRLCLWGLWGLFTADPASSQSRIEVGGRTFQTREVGQYALPEPEDQATVLRMSYAQARIWNPRNWSASFREDRIPVQIDLVYTGYPRDTADWLTDFGDLMQRRMDSLFALDPSLAHDLAIEWRLVRQTGCSTWQEAMRYFHGFVIHYTPRTGGTAAPIPQQEHATTEPDGGEVLDAFDLEDETRSHRRRRRRRRSPRSQEEVFETYVQQYVDENMAVVDLMLGADFDPSAPAVAWDDVQTHVIDAFMRRHPDWRGMRVVVDWTASMYPYGTQLVRWHEYYIERGLIDHMVFTNDGNGFEWFRRLSAHGRDAVLDVLRAKVSSTSRRVKYILERDLPMGNRGGLYFCDTVTMDRVREQMLTCMSHGSGDELPENNMEAILAALERYPTGGPLVAIVDNCASVIDLPLLSRLDEPVHLIVCGARDRRDIHPDYLKIALRTGGSLTTLDEELYFDPERGLRIFRYDSLASQPRDSLSRNWGDWLCNLPRRAPEKCYEPDPQLCTWWHSMQDYADANMDSVRKVIAAGAMPCDALPLSLSAYPDLAVVDSFFRRMTTPPGGWVAVSDWTGAMYPYTARLWALHQANRRKLLSVLALFNDGDGSLHMLGQSDADMSRFLRFRNRFRGWGDFELISRLPVRRPLADSLERGGVYFMSNPDSASVLATMRQAMWRGFGDEVADHNIEALVRTARQFPEASALLHIADNRAPVADMHRLEHLDRPVHLILTGVGEEGPRPEFVHLAWQTGGSITLPDTTFRLSPADSVLRHDRLLLGPWLYAQGSRGHFRPDPRNRQMLVIKHLEIHREATFAELAALLGQYYSSSYSDRKRRKKVWELLERLESRDLICMQGRRRQAVFSLCKPPAIHR